MKLTLTQAYGAAGLSGALLRGAVAGKLRDRWLEGNRERLGQSVVLFTVAFVCVVALLVLYTNPSFGYLLNHTDLSRTADAVGFVLVVAFAVVVGPFIALLFAVASVSEAWKAGSAERYIFQHRDDEVEL